MDRLTHPTPSHTHELLTAGGQGVTHQYDALGSRVARTASGSTTVFVQVDQQTICDYASGAAPASSTYRYLYASYIDEPIVRIATSNSETTWYHRNQQYSIVACTDSSGAATERYAYTAYGLPTITDGSGTVRTSSAIGNRYTYTGREWDGVLGLYHYRARMYEATVGRFCSRDLIGYVDGVVLYQYVHARPVVNVDPSGNEDIEFPYPIDLPEERPAYADFHYQQSKCKKPSDCLVDCDKPEDWCRFFFVFVGHPKGAQFQIYHQKSGKCGADINRKGKATFIEIVFKDRLSCRLVPNDFP